MARGISIELRCGGCHSSSIFPEPRRARESTLGELYVSPSGTWMAWSGPYERQKDRERNWLPGPRQLSESGPGTTWRPVPQRGVVHECAEFRHTITLTESELWTLLRSLPADQDILYLPSRESADQSQRLAREARRTGLDAPTANPSVVARAAR